MIKKEILIAVVLLLASFGCTKDKESQQVNSLFEDDIAAIADKAIAGMDSQEVFSDDQGMALYMLDDGIAPDFLIEETDLTGTDAQRAHIRDRSVIACLKKLSLTPAQKDSVVTALRQYKHCREKAITRAREIYHDLQAKYKEKYNRIHNAFLSGSITREKFNALVKELRHEFKRELRSLHLKEKLDEAFRTCFKQFLRTLHPILTERQWNAFVACCKH